MIGSHCQVGLIRFQALCWFRPKEGQAACCICIEFIEVQLLVPIAAGV